MLVWIKSCAVFAIVLLAIQFAYGRDPDGRYTNSPLHDCYEQLASKKGRCYSDADGMTISDVDWESHDGHYRVRIDGSMFPTIPLSPSPIEPSVDGLADLVERTPAYSLLHAGEHDLKRRSDRTHSIRRKRLHDHESCRGSSVGRASETGGVRRKIWTVWLLRLIPVNEFAIDFPPERVDDRYLQVLIVAQAAVTEMLRKRFAVCDSLEIVIEVDPDPVS
jgi:hypothetical protein